MKFGVSLSGFAQQPAGTDPTKTLQDILVYVRTARDLGFDFIYQGQHYLTGPIQQLQTIPLLARAAAEAEGMGIVATLLVPLHSPVDLAERVTTMDIDRCGLRMMWPGMALERGLHGLELFASEVMPAFVRS